MDDMAPVIIPKSDQWNSDDFQAGPITFSIVSVAIKGGQEQPVAISVHGSDKVYRPCKSMARVLVSAWGADSSKYIGRSLTLYCDPRVKWGGMEVGGIRISHMSDIEKPLTMALTMTRANKKPYTVKPLGATDAARPEAISEAQKKRLEARIGEVGANREEVKAYVLKTWGKEHFADLTKSEYSTLDAMIDKKAAASSGAQI